MRNEVILVLTYAACVLYVTACSHFHTREQNKQPKTIPKVHQFRQRHKISQHTLYTQTHKYCVKRRGGQLFLSRFFRFQISARL